MMLETIRRFRDEVLSKSIAGRKVINLYYKTAEKTIEILNRNPTIKKFAKVLTEALVPMLELLLNKNEYL